MQDVGKFFAPFGGYFSHGKILKETLVLSIWNFIIYIKKKGCVPFMEGTGLVLPLLEHPHLRSCVRSWESKNTQYWDTVNAEKEPTAHCSHRPPPVGKFQTGQRQCR